MQDERGDYLYKVDYDAPKINGDEEEDIFYAGMLYVYDKEDVNKKNPLTAYVIDCYTIPELIMDTTELAKVRTVTDFSSAPTIRMYITESITGSNLEEIKSKINFRVIDDVEGYAIKEIEWYENELLDTEYSDHYLYGNVTLEPEAGSDTLFSSYAIECRGLSYLTEIKEEALGVISWKEHDSLIIVKASEGYVADEEENSTLERIKNSIVLAEGYTAEVTFKSVDYRETQADYNLKIYKGDELVREKTISYEISY